jgi:uncharacterized protein YjeT (DUF2065 family)
MWESLIQALCLLLIIEGMAPFIHPRRWRKLVASMATVKDQQLRFFGLASMLLGLAVLSLLS